MAVQNAHLSWKLLLLGVGMLASGVALPAAANADEDTATVTAGASTGLFADFRTPDARMPFARYEGTWPDRAGFPSDSARKGVVRELEGRVAALDTRRWFQPLDQRQVDGLFAAWREDVADAASIPEGIDQRFPGFGAFVVSARMARGPTHHTANHPGPLLTLRHTSVSHETTQPGTHNAGSLEMETTWFQLFAPQTEQAPGAADTWRGVVVLMPGMYATPEGTLSQLTRRLTKEGWGVLRMVAQPSNFTRVFSIEIDPANPADGPERIARAFDTRAASCAYGVRDACAFLEDRFPALRHKPRAIIGFSAGAMTLPTVVAYEADRYDASVLVGGGCHFWLMQVTSNYADWLGIASVRWSAPPTPAQMGAVEDAYLRASRLDSFHTARALHGRPRLMIQGEADLAVPSPLGDVLFVRATSPEGVTPDRDLLPVGHEALFAMLPRSFDRIVMWLDAKVPGAGTAQPANNLP